MEYWLPEYPFHIIKQGVVKIQVKGKDNTPPNIGWVQVRGDNIIHAKVYDGSKVQSVKATIILKDDPSKTFDVELKDDGIEEDSVAGDNVFSKKIPGQKFGFYRVILEATDSFGNKTTEEAPDTFVLH